MNKKFKSLIVAGTMAGTLLSLGHTASAESENPIIQNQVYNNLLNFTTANGEELKIGKIQNANPKFNKALYFSPQNIVTPEVKKIDNGIEQTITIDPLHSNSEYEVPFDFKNGESIELEKDGSAVVYNDNKESIAVIMPADVKTESGEVLDVETTLNNDTLRYNVNFNGTNEPVKIQMAALSYTYSQYFSSASWITRSGMISLSVQPKNLVLKASGSPNVTAAIRTDSFNKLQARHSGDSKWKNTSSMRNQYLCHVDLAQRFKTPWNLEPHRPTVSYAKTLKAFCNPE